MNADAIITLLLSERASRSKVVRYGMRWTIAGGGAMATLRCQQASRSEDGI